VGDDDEKGQAQVGATRSEVPFKYAMVLPAFKGVFVRAQKGLACHNRPGCVETHRSQRAVRISSLASGRMPIHADPATRCRAP